MITFKVNDTMVNYYNRAEENWLKNDRYIAVFKNGAINADQCFVADTPHNGEQMLDRVLTEVLRYERGEYFDLTEYLARREVVAEACLFASRHNKADEVVNLMHPILWI